MHLRPAASCAATCRRQPFTAGSQRVAPACRAVKRAQASNSSSSFVLSGPSVSQSIRQQQQQERGVCRVGRREGVYFFGFGGGDDDGYDEAYTVFKLQIGVFGDIPRWQSKLNNIATKYDTEDPEELHHVFTDSLMLVLRNMEYVGYATSGGKVFQDIESAEAKFNSVLMEERIKFKEETLVNVDGRRKTRSLDKKGEGDGMDRWLCMTLLVAVEGKVKLPNIGSTWELKKVLTDLGGVSADALVALELLWTPQEEDDAYSKQELLSDYPTMATLS